MNTDDLLEELDRNDINQKACLVLPVHRVEGAICLTHENDGRWLVSLVERGDCVIENYFPHQDAACRYFLKFVLSDPTFFEGFSMEEYEVFKRKSAKLLEEYGF